jgi:hypothetical protein
MAGTEDFLKHVLPHTGPYCIVVMAPNAEVPHQLAAEDEFDENSGELRRSALSVACDIVRRQDSLGKNTFIAVGALVNAKTWDRKDQRFRVKREGDNIRALRAYTMDIDAGPRKKGNAVRDHH